MIPNSDKKVGDSFYSYFADSEDNFFTKYENYHYGFIEA